MKVSYQNQDAWSDMPNSPLAKGYLDIPCFEDAFDTLSLRKFYSEQESTNSQSVLSPQKTSSFFEDETESPPSPFARHLMNHYQNGAPLQAPLFNFPGNMIVNHHIQFSPQEPFNVVRRVKSNVETLSAPSFNNFWDNTTVHRPATNVQIVMKQGNMTVKKPFVAGQGGSQSPPVNHVPEILPLVQRAQSMYTDTQPSLPSLIQKNQSVCEESKNERFEKMLKSKKVFKVHREEQRKQIVINFKKKAASALNEGTTPKIGQKKAKACLPVVKKSVVFNFTASSDQNKASSPSSSPTNFFNIFEGRQEGQGESLNNSFMNHNADGKVEFKEFPWSPLE